MRRLFVGLIALAMTATLGGYAAPSSASVVRKTYYLYDRPTTGTFGDWSEDSVDINNRTFGKSVVGSDEGDPTPNGATEAGRYNLQGKCFKLRFVAGVTDDSDTSTEAVFAVVTDGRVLENFNVQYGDSARRTYDVTGAQNLTLVVRNVSDANMTAGYGGARIICKPLR
jgi:hypothetical protein